MAQKDLYIINGPEDDYDISKESLGRVIYNRLKNRNPEEIVNVDAKTKEVLTCGELLENSKKCVEIYRKLGIQNGDTISIISENSINYFTPVLAAFYMGIAVNPVNPGYMKDELQHYLRIAQPKLILVHSENSINTIMDLKEEMKLEASILLIHSRSNIYPSVDCLEDLLSTSHFELKNFEPLDFDYSEQIALIMLSSGTTGLPKGVKITHQNLRYSIGFCCHPKYGNVIPEEITLITIPFYHIYGLILQLIGFVTSTTCIILDRFKPDVFLESIQEYKVTKLYTVPPLVLFLLQHPLVNKCSLSSIRDIVVAGAPLSKETEIEVYKRYPFVQIKQFYGLTEYAGPCTIKNNTNKIGSAGCIGPKIVAKVIDPDTKETLGPLKKGELCFKGPMLMKGYIPQQDHLDEDGFFCTGDSGYYDEDGYFYIEGRYKELIKYKGFQVSPVELEALIMTHPAVKDCGVVGIPDERAGELPTAFVVVVEDVKCAGLDIVDYVAERISVQKQLYGGVKFVKEIPRNSNGKIMRKALKEML